MPRCGCRQRTSASTPSSSRLRQVDDRLELDEELVARQPEVDVLLQPQAVVQLFLHVRLEQHAARLAGCLRVVHGDVGVAQQLFGVVARPRAGDADAGGRVGFPAVEQQRPVECGA